MDLFVEQLVVRKNTTKETIFRAIAMIVFGLTAGSALLVAVFGIFGIYSFFGIPVAALICYAAYYFNGKLNLEFEYSLTNGDFDVDLIINRKKRERITAFECRNIEKISVFDPNAHHGDKDLLIAANMDAPRLLLIDVVTKKGGRVNLVIEPDDRVYAALKRCVPRHLTAQLPE